MIFYRIVKTNPPTLADFTSNEAFGKALPNDDPETVRLWSGISAFATAIQARNKAADFPFPGPYVAMLDIEAGGPVRYERTGPRSPGHHTLWGEPAELIARVTTTVAISDLSRSE